MNEDNFDFNDALRELEFMSESDPDRFEELREQLIRMTISSFPDRFQQRARGIQFLLDYELGKQKDPVSRMNRMVELFWKQFHEFNSAMNDPVRFAAELEKNKKTGKVLRLH
jgi:hypothetical protein